MTTNKPNTIDEYIAEFPAATQKLLQEMRATIKKAAPDAEETIKYCMPTFTLKGNLVYFAAFRHHIGFFPLPAALEAFKEELAVYKTGKGSIQFPLDQPLPIDLIAKMVKFRVQRQLEKAEIKKKR